MLTCDAVISETLFLLKREGHNTDDLFALVHAGFLRSEFEFHAEYRHLRDLMRRYRSRPMAFADACLVRMAELRPEAELSPPRSRWFRGRVRRKNRGILLRRGRERGEEAPEGPSRVGALQSISGARPRESVDGGLAALLEPVPDRAVLREPAEELSGDTTAATAEGRQCSDAVRPALVPQFN